MKKLLPLLPVLGLALCASCTPAQSATTVTALDDVQKACIFAEESLPILGLPAPDLQTVEQACTLEGIADSTVQQVINVFQPQIASLMAKKAALAKKP